MKILFLVLLPTLLFAEQRPNPEMMQKMMEARFHLNGVFDKDLDAKVPVGDLSLPERAVARIDVNGDGYITFDEYTKMQLNPQLASGPAEPRDRSDFTHLRKGGFPLNVNPEIVSADKVEIGDEDMVMGVVINGEPRAYPVNYMNGPFNEIVNDELGGEAIAPSW